MKRIILYRFHNKIEICKNRIELLRKFNPGVPVYGLYGGKEDEFEFYALNLASDFDDIYCIRNKPDEWKWKNSDLAIRLWHKDFGHTIDYDMVHIMEWDLILLDSLDNLYRHIPGDTLGITGLVPLKKIEKRWFWIRDEKQKSQWVKLREFAKQNLNFEGEGYGSLGPGLCYPKSFLEAYNKIEVPDLCNDELRLPFMAKALGFEVMDTGFFKKWFSKKELKYFNCNNIEVERETMMKQYGKKNGRRVFHPFRELLDPKLFI